VNECAIGRLFSGLAVRFYRLCPILAKGLDPGTPFNNPIAELIDEYQVFLKSLGYSPIVEAVYGKKGRQVRHVEGHVDKR